MGIVAPSGGPLKTVGALVRGAMNIMAPVVDPLDAADLWENGQRLRLSQADHRNAPRLSELGELASETTPCRAG